MSQFSDFYQLISRSTLSHWLYTLPNKLREWERNSLLSSNCIKWINTVENLPELIPMHLDLLHSVYADNDPPLSANQRAWVESLLRQLIPWRKGPFSLYGVTINTEWRSDWKWERLIPHIKPLKGRIILDVGGGSGYYLWRMVGAGAKLAVGIDPMQLFFYQFSAVRKLLGSDLRAHMLPLGIEQLPELAAFDTVFSMGVLYHRRSPFEHLLQLRNQLISGGELVLETLVITGESHKVFIPKKCYAKMRNVYFIPSLPALINWLKICGFVDICHVNTSVTSIDEQRRTSWITGQSLSDFLHPDDKSLTIEGNPSPQRVIIVAKKP